jgi:hypothetical protein
MIDRQYTRCVRVTDSKKPGLCRAYMNSMRLFRDYRETELEYEGELKGGDAVARELIRSSVAKEWKTQPLRCCKRHGRNLARHVSIECRRIESGVR